MLSVLNNRTYRHLFTAQVIALVGTGLMTVALGLLAYELAGADAGAVLGTALAIKMLAYAGVAPVAQAFADRLPRRSLLVALDLVRAAVALCLPFVTEVWQGTPTVTPPKPHGNSTRPDLENPDGARICWRFAKSIQDSLRISTRRSTARAPSARSGIASNARPRPCARRTPLPPPSATPSGGKGPAGRGVGPVSRPKPLRKRFPAFLAHPPRAALPDPASARQRPSGALCGASDSPPCAWPWSAPRLPPRYPPPMPRTAQSPRP